MNAANYKTTILETVRETVAIMLALPEHRPDDARLAVVLIETGTVYHVVDDPTKITTARKLAAKLADTNDAWNRCSTQQHGAPKAWRRFKKNGPVISLRAELARQHS